MCEVHKPITKPDRSPDGNIRCSRGSANRRAMYLAKLSAGRYHLCRPEAVGLISWIHSVGSVINFPCRSIPRKGVDWTKQIKPTVPHKPSSFLKEHPILIPNQHYLVRRSSSARLSACHTRSSLRGAQWEQGNLEYPCGSTCRLQSPLGCCLRTIQSHGCSEE
jgi:hypothetical protein